MEETTAHTFVEPISSPTTILSFISCSPVTGSNFCFIFTDYDLYITCSGSLLPSSCLVRLIDCSKWLVQLMLTIRSEEHTSELQSRGHLVCRLLLEKKKTKD